MTAAEEKAPSAQGKPAASDPPAAESEPVGSDARPGGTPRPAADPEPDGDSPPPGDSKPDGDGAPAASPERPRPLEPVPPPDPAESPEPDTPPAAARAAERGSDAEAAGGADGADEADDANDAEAAADDTDDVADHDHAGVSSLADKVQAVLVAAESTAERIRRKAEADAEQIAEERDRQRHAARELVHLERLADALSVQAESVKRQCGVLKGLLPAVEDARASGTEARAPEPEGEVRIRDLRGERSDSGDHDGAEAGKGEADGPAEHGRHFPRISRERVEAYRMKLAGARRTDVEAYLAAAGVDEAAEITAELFDPLAPARSPR